MSIKYVAKIDEHGVKRTVALVSPDVDGKIFLSQFLNTGHDFQRKTEQALLDAQYTQNKLEQMRALALYWRSQVRHPCPISATCMTRRKLV